MSYNQPKRQDKIFVDGAIRAKTVLVIDGESNENLGLMPTYEALRRASERGLNLLQMSPVQGTQPPTCKIMDYGKYKYDESKRAKAQSKKQREAKVEDRELTFRPDTAIHDLEVKARKAIEFLDAGSRLKVTIKCRGREVTHPDVYRKTLSNFIQLIPHAIATPVSNDGWDAHLRFSYQITRNESEKKKTG